MTTDFERRLMRVIDHVHDHPAEDLNLDRLARVAALSPYHFHRVFRGITGETLAHMVRRVRMERAATLLTFGTLPIAEIAQTVGYPNVASFTRAFSEMYGLPPERIASAAPIDRNY
ncbi:MAG: helix-turn-helix domain-containing protein [Polyangiaceae bacterium]